MRDTDASGVIYFASVQEIALEAFEDFLHKNGYCLDSILQGDFLFPIVHTEADYLSPIKVGDELSVHMKISHIGNSSFVIKCDLFSLKADLTVATVSITHVTMCKESKVSIPIPEELVLLFEDKGS
jgi:YbgC/YbaW family acyl-CoA thioester hydrolase